MANFISAVMFVFKPLIRLLVYFFSAAASALASCIAPTAARTDSTLRPAIVAASATIFLICSLALAGVAGVAGTAGVSLGVAGVAGVAGETQAFFLSFSWAVVKTQPDGLCDVTVRYCQPLKQAVCQSA